MKRPGTAASLPLDVKDHTITRLEKYGIPLGIAANVFCKLIASRNTLADFNPSSMIVAFGGLVVAFLAMAIMFLEYRRPRTQ